MKALAKTPGEECVGCAEEGIVGVRVQRNRLERGAEAPLLMVCQSQRVERIGRPVGQLSIAGGALGAHARRGAARASAHHGLGLYGYSCIVLLRSTFSTGSLSHATNVDVRA